MIGPVLLDPKLTFLSDKFSGEVLCGADELMDPFKLTSAAARRSSRVLIDNEFGELTFLVGVVVSESALMDFR